jgi:hypothetical protein
MRTRPTSITVIAWIIIVGALLSLFGVARFPTNPLAQRMIAESRLPMSAHIGFAVLVTVVTLVAGYGMLKGYAWSRWLYVGTGVVSLIFSVLTFPVVSILIISGLFLFVMAFFLFRRAADDWFDPAESR